MGFRWEFTAVPKTARDATLEHRSKRLRIAVRKEPYWIKVDQGLYLGYYRTDPAGSWWARKLIPGTKRYTKAALGAADDAQSADGAAVLSYFQAADKARQLSAEHSRTDTPQLKRATVADAAKQYMEWFATARKSIRETQAVIDAHILPAFGALPLAELRAARIRGWLDKLAKAPPRKRSRRGAPVQYREPPGSDDGKRARLATANRIYNVARAILNFAFTHGMVSDDTEWRKVKAFPRADEPVTRFLTAAESERLVNACRPDLRRLVKAALFTGARYSELAGMRCSDFNPDTDLLYVRPSKSGKGRHLPLNEQGLDFFRSAATGKKGADPLFARADGAPWGKNYHVRGFADACAIARIDPPITFHVLRHTYASLLAQAGADLLTISKLLGHADTRITSRHYAHLCDRTLAHAVGALPGFGHEAGRKVVTIR